MAAVLRIGVAAAIFALSAPAQDFSKITIETIGKNLQFTEGPVWSKDGFMIFSDTVAGKIWKWAPGSEAVTFREPSNGASGNAFDTQGRLYTCETHTRRVTRTNMKDGRVDVLADQWDGKKLNAPCDLAVSKSDHVYFTDPAFGGQQDHRELDFYGVYHIPPKGQMKLAAKWTTRPNGIALAPNGRTLYVSAPDEHSIRAYDLDKEGDASNERVFAAKIDGVPGGMRTDEKGNLYVAANGIQVFHPDGKLAATIPVHERPSNCAFGGPDGMTFFITARGNLYRTKVDVKGSY
jgi:gluconolactonase